MNAIERLLNSVNEIENKIPEFLKESLQDNESFAVELNTGKQLYEHGITAYGVQIHYYRPYKPRTVALKKKKGQPYDRVTLKDTGDWYGSIKGKTKSEYFEINGDTPYQEYLLKRYGNSILGLTDENLSVLLTEKIRPEVIQKIKDYYNG